MRNDNNVVIQGVCEIADILIAGSLIVGLFILTNLGSAPQGLRSFLQERLTLDHAIMGSAFLFIFHFVFRVFGAYDEAARNFRGSFLA